MSRRERQILDVLFRRREATASEIQADIPDAPGYSAVRAVPRILEDGPRYVYLPVLETEIDVNYTLTKQDGRMSGGNGRILP